MSLHALGMDPVTPRIVIEPEEGDIELPPLSSPRPSSPRCNLPQGHVQRPGGREEVEGGSAFAKLVQTIRFIKKWAGRAENPQDQREQFLGRFRMSVPNIDDALAQHGGDGERGKSGEVVVRSRRLLPFFNPSGIWLFRWLFVITMTVLYNAFMIIVRETFDPLQRDLLPLWLTLDYVADIVYILDMVVQFRTSE